MDAKQRANGIDCDVVGSHQPERQNPSKACPGQQRVFRDDALFLTKRGRRSTVKVFIT